MEQWVGKIAIVTGASAGIGAAITEKLVKEGLKVVGFARRPERVQALAKKLEKEKGSLHAYAVDITQEADIIKGFNWVLDTLGPIHILINNAGILITGSLLDDHAANWKKIYDTNVIGLSIATREAIKSMRSNNIDGYIIHISSLAAHRVEPIPGMNVYSSSKFAVKALTETLRQELAQLKSKIRITSISPGATTTEIFETSGLGARNTELLDKIPFLEAEDLADAVSYVLSTPPSVQVHDIVLRPLGGL